MNIKIVWFIITLILISAVTTLVYQKTQQADINYYRGHRFFEKGEYKKTMEFCEKALAINPSHPGALKDLAYACQWTGDYQRAIEVFNQILSINPQDYRIMQALAETLAWNKQYEESIVLCKKVVSLTGEVKPQRQLAQVYIWNSQPEEAKKILETILKNNPDDSQAKLLLAKALQYLGETKEAIKLYKELLQKNK